MDAIVKDQTIYEIGCLLIDLSKSGLQGKEIEYLIPFEEIFKKKKTPASITRERLALGKNKALEWCMIDNFEWR